VVVTTGPSGGNHGRRGPSSGNHVFEGFEWWKSRVWRALTWSLAGIVWQPTNSWEWLVFQFDVV
jgi:hypothetical protein